MRQHLECVRQQRVARERRDRFAINLVISRPSATHIVVVHARQVVVNQRVCVNHLDCARESHRGFDLTAYRLARRQREHRPQALAAREERIAHRLMQARSRAGRFLDALLERALDELRALL